MEEAASHIRKNFFSIPWIWFLFLGLPTVVFFPSFITEFGIHNDYRFIPGSFADRQIFSEAEHLFVVGRALQYFLVILQGWCIQKISDFAVVRFLSFLFMLGFGVLFVQFLKRFTGFDTFWASLAVPAVMMLPASAIYVLWTAHFLPGYVTLLLALISYSALSRVPPLGAEAGMSKTRLGFWFLGAFIIFLAALFMYPMNAVFVFTCTFAVLFFSSTLSFAQKGKIFFRDVVFYGAGMLVYLLINLFWILPNAAPEVLASHELGGTAYDFNITFALGAKISLLVETFLIALGGVGHSLIGSKGIFLHALILVGSALACLYLYFQKNDYSTPRGQRREKIFHWLIGSSAGIILFLLANAPALTAKGNFSLIGYRVLFPSAVIMVLCQFWLWRQLATVLKSHKFVLFVKFFAVGFVLLSSLSACLNVVDISRNARLELQIVQQKARQINYEKTGRIMVIVVPEGETLIERVLPFEMGYMITLPAMVAPVLEEEARKKGIRDVPPVSVDEGKVVFIDDYTYVLDINEARIGTNKGIPRRTTKPLALVKTSASAERRIEISRERGISFVFQENTGTARIPFWLVDLSSPRPPWLQMEFDSAQMLKAFTFAVFAAQSSQSSPVGCRLKGSQDGRNWRDLDIGVVHRSGVDKNFKVYHVRNPDLYTLYRFDLQGEEPFQQPLPIRMIHFIADF